MPEEGKRNGDDDDSMRMMMMDEDDNKEKGFYSPTPNKRLRLALRTISKTKMTRKIDFGFGSTPGEKPKDNGVRNGFGQEGTGTRNNDDVTPTPDLSQINRNNRISGSNLSDDMENNTMEQLLWKDELEALNNKFIDFKLDK